MIGVLFDLMLLPVKLVLLLIELLGRSLALFVGLAMFGVGALFCVSGPMILFGAPICLLSALLIIKAL